MVGITLQHDDINGGTAVAVNCQSAVVNFNKNNQKKPNANNIGPVQVHTQGYENLKYILRGIRLVSGSNQLTYADVLTLYKATFDGTDAATLTITYGDSDTVLIDMDGNSSGIKVVLDGNIAIPFDAADSRNAYMPVFDLTFIETKETA